jgi:hypothetical protein
MPKTKGTAGSTLHADESPKSPRDVRKSTIKSSSYLSEDGHEKVSALSPKRSGETKEAVETPTPHSNRKKAANASSSRDVSPMKATNIFGHKVVQDPRVSKVYKMIHKYTGTLGGNGYDGAIYGELTQGSMQKVLDIMVEKLGMDNQSRFIDVGSGLGKPNFHAAQNPQVRLSVGIELEEIRYQMAMVNMKNIALETENGLVDGSSNEDVKLLGGTNFMVGDIDVASYTDPFTHIYMYDLGFPPPLQKSIAQKFNNSQHAVALVSYRPPRRVIEEYGYAVEFIDSFCTSMHGSGEGHTAYFYKRTNKPPALRNSPEIQSVVLPKRDGFVGEKDVTVTCDAAFLECVELAVGPIEQLRDFSAQVVNDTLLSEDRPKRERRPRRITDV